MAEDQPQDDNHEEEDFNPVGTVWILVGFFLLIIAFWGYTYFEMLSRA